MSRDVPEPYKDGYMKCVDELTHYMQRVSELRDTAAAAQRRMEHFEVENEQLRARIVILLKCHYAVHEHRGTPTCFDVQSPADEWETEALGAAMLDRG